MRQKILLLGFLNLVLATVQLHASVSKTQPGLLWKPTAFSPMSQVIGAPQLYLGAEFTPPFGSEAFSLARAFLASDDTGVNITSLAPANGTNNAIKLNTVDANSPLNNQIISDLTLLNSIYPVAIVDQSGRSEERRVGKECRL